MSQYGRGGRGVRRVYETDDAALLYAGLDLALRKLGGKKRLTRQILHSKIK